jgi:hypothetical protein
MRVLSITPTSKDVEVMWEVYFPSHVFLPQDTVLKPEVKMSSFTEIYGDKIEVGDVCTTWSTHLSVSLKY